MSPEAPKAVRPGAQAPGRAFQKGGSGPCAISDLALPQKLYFSRSSANVPISGTPRKLWYFSSSRFCTLS